MKTRQKRWSGLARSGLLLLPTMVVVSALATTCVRAGDTDATTAIAREKFFEQNVRPLLAEKCYSCHATKKQKGGLRLDSLEAILKGGESGPAVVPGKPEESLIVSAINYAGPEMPPDAKLAPEKVAVLKRWVAWGAPWPTGNGKAHAEIKPAGGVGSGLEPVGKALWSLQPVRDGKPPQLSGAREASWSLWPRNSIDNFVIKALRDRGLTPAAEANRVSLIRRVTFDLTGLPPTPEEVDAYVADQGPNAYEQLVDRLLGSPAYGQRWATHWLDLVRYAESDGFRQDAFRPQAWRYRDYVVRAFNTDKPYDRFLSEQLAGDELDADDPELKVALGYLRLGAYEYNQRNVPGQWADILNEMTDVTGEVFLGLSIGCARCHDHKFDPILQEDYYRLQAFFTPLMLRDDLTIARAKEWATYQAKRTVWEKAAARVLAQIAEIEQPYRDKGASSALAKFPEDIQTILGKPERERTPFEKQIGALASRQIAFEYGQVPAQIKGKEKLRWEALQKELKSFDAMKPVSPATVLTATDVGPVSPPTMIPGESSRGAIEPGFPSALCADWRLRRGEPASAAVDRAETCVGPLVEPGRQPAFDACDRESGLAVPFRPRTCRNAERFRRLGEPPSHPELLDWLAMEFVRQGWRLKPLHRLILTSAAYRQSASRSPTELAAAQRVDPENRVLWKRTVGRLGAEEIRDAMLAVSGELGKSIGGPGASGEKARRTIDTRVIRNAPDELVEAFDGPGGTTSTARRNSTTTAPQALLLVNGEWTLARAEAFATRIERATPGSVGLEAKVVAAYRLAFGRRPEPGELGEAVSFLGRQARSTGAAPHRADATADHSAVVDFCHVILNSNEFIYVD